MRDFGINLKGRVKNFNLPKSQSLVPLYEAIVNSFHAIEERTQKEFGFKNGIINIFVERDQQFKVEDMNIIPPVEGFSIKDNGIGFNEDNISSFSESDSTYKEALGGKGVGRFSWLIAFQEVNIESIYKEDNGYVKRSFSFTLDSNGIDDELIDIDSANDNLTCVKLKNCFSGYQETLPKQLDKIATGIIHHCLIYFMSDICPEVYLSDENDRLHLNKLFREKTNTDENTLNFTIDDEEFHLLHVKAKDRDIDGNKLFLCAHNRLVQTKDLNKYIVDLDKSMYNKSGFWYIGVLSGKYLDSNVDMNRLSFSIHDKSSENRISNILSMDNILEDTADKIKDYLNDFLAPIGKSKIQKIKDYVTNEAPHFRHLMKYMPDEIAKIKPNLSTEKLDDELYRIKRMLDKDIKENNIGLLKLLKDGIISNEEYKDKFQIQISKVVDANSSVLAEYVAHRKVIIDLLEIAIRRKEDGSFEKEKYVHDLIYPTRTTSDTEPYKNHNLWLIDEKLAYCNYISSDIPFNNAPKEQRPDIMILDHPVAVSDEKNDGTEFDTIVIFELKRPMRDDYNNDDSNPIEQLYSYVEKIKSGKVEDKNGRPIKTGINTKFYLYAICDITEKLERKIRFGGVFKQTPDKMGYYGYNDSYNAYIEILSFDKIINDSNKRNKVLFEHLGL